MGAKKGCCSCVSSCLLALFLVGIGLSILFYIFFRSGQPLEMTAALQSDGDGIILFTPVAGDDGWRAFIRSNEADPFLQKFIKGRFRSVLPHHVALIYSVRNDRVCRTFAVNPNRFASLLKLASLPNYLKPHFPEFGDLFEAKSDRNLITAGNCKEVTQQIHAAISKQSKESKTSPVNAPSSAELLIFLNNRDEMFERDGDLKRIFSPLTSVERGEIEAVRGWVDILDAEHFTSEVQIQMKHELTAKLLLPRIRSAISKKLEAWEEKRGVQLAARWESEGKNIYLTITGSQLQNLLYGE